MVARPLGQSVCVCVYIVEIMQTRSIIIYTNVINQSRGEGNHERCAGHTEYKSARLDASEIFTLPMV